MTKKTRWIRSALAALAVLGGLAAQASTTTLHLTTEVSPPFNMLEGEKIVGRATDQVVEMMARAKVGFTMELLPWARAYNMALKEADTCVFTTTRTPEREALFKWVGPISPRRIVVYKLASRSELSLSELRQLQGAKIGVVRESATARQLLAEGFKPGEELEFGLDDATNVRKLLAGRMEYVMLLDWAAAWNLRQLKLPYATLQAVLDYDNSKSYWYGLPPDTDPALVRRLQAALDATKRDGRYELLKLRYFS